MRGMRERPVPVVLGCMAYVAVPAAAQCGPPGAGDCCVAGRGPGCADAACCTAVCTADPFCCETVWDAVCADLAAQACPGCPPGPPPPNDDCAGALVIVAGRAPFDTANTTTDGPVHTCASSSCGGDLRLHRDVWFDWTATSGGLVAVSSCGATTFDAKVAVYQGCSCDGLETSLLACNDDGTDCPGGGFEAIFAANEGVCYRIRVGSATGQTGRGTFSIEPVVSDCPGEGPCGSAHNSPGCEDLICCQTVCGVDPFCCDVVWDQICANEALNLCDLLGKCTCTFIPGGDCCIASGGFGCEVPLCCLEVCGFDPSCCDFWDGACADLARHFCPDVCPPLPSPCVAGAGDCCAHHGAPGCDDPACCEAVCDADPLCCSAAWDGPCAELAAAICTCPPGPAGCGNPAAGPCCVPNGSPYCADAACCEAVCAVDSFCCSVEWDAGCADRALTTCSTLPLEMPAAILMTGRPAPGSAGAIVTGLGFPTVNGPGQPAVTGELGGGADHFVWVDGRIVWRNSDALPVVLNGAQPRMGLGDDGRWAYVPRDGGADVIWVDGRRLIGEGDFAPGIGTVLTRIDKVSMLDDSTVTWRAGLTPPSFAAIYRGLEPVVQTGDVFQGFTIAPSLITLAHDFSGDGAHLAFEAHDPQGASFVVADGEVVIVQGQPNGAGGTWSWLRDVGINDAGLDVVCDSNGWIGVDGQAVTWQGPFFAHVAVNDEGVVVFQRAFAPILGRLSVGGGGPAEVTELLTEGDPVRLPMDCSTVATVYAFKTSDTAQPILELSGNEFVHVNASLVTEGKEVVEAIVRVPLSAGTAGDLDGDGTVGVRDLLILLSSWGPCPGPPADCAADLDGSGNVGIADLLLLLSAWGP